MMEQADVTAVLDAGIFRDDAAKRHHVGKPQRRHNPPRFALVGADNPGDFRLRGKDPDKRLSVSVNKPIHARAVDVSLIFRREPLIDARPRFPAVRRQRRRTGMPAVPYRPDAQNRFPVWKENGRRVSLINRLRSLSDNDLLGAVELGNVLNRQIRRRKSVSQREKRRCRQRYTNS